MRICRMCGLTGGCGCLWAEKTLCKRCEAKQQGKELPLDLEMEFRMTPKHLGGHKNKTHVDAGALAFLLGFYNIRTMVDIGCGPGGMEKAAQSMGIEWTGVDGDPTVIRDGIVQHDFTTGAWPREDEYDLAWSVEFLEHVEPEFMDNYLALFKRARVAFVTAAPPGTPGTHHVNCQEFEYWEQVFNNIGFAYNDVVTQGVRKVSSMKREFTKRGWVFERVGEVETLPDEDTPQQPLEESERAEPSPLIVPSGVQSTRGVLVHWGVGGKTDERPYADFVRRYAESQGLDYQGFYLDSDFFKAADVVKRAAMAVIWNGSQGKGPLCRRLCERRGIPHVFFEWGMLPQKETFFVDPKGFCGDSVLNGPLHWVTDLDRMLLEAKRAELQKKYPLRDEGFVLVPLQIECDSQVLYHSPYVDMNEFIAHVESLYPKDKIVIRPHPKGGKRHRKSRRYTREIFEGDFLDWASRASVVVGITSTCLYEAGILGVPVVAMGDHPLRSHRQADHDDVLAGALALTVRRDTGDLGAVLDRFGVRPLGKGR